jgi:hypothetical protein
MKKVFILPLCFLLFPSISFGQALMDFEYPMLDNLTSFLSQNYDTALIRRNKVEICQQNNQTFYFDIDGRLLKHKQISDSDTQIFVYHYDDRGGLRETEITSSKYQAVNPLINYKTYEQGRLIKDSTNSQFCTHLDYYQNGSLRQELHFVTDHRLLRGFWFGVDTEGRITRIIQRDYFRTVDSTGQLVSDRTLYYNEKSQLIREEESVPWEQGDEKTFFCPNAGSAIFHYDTTGRMVEIERTTGPSQKIKYLQSGLIAEIETMGKNCEGTSFHWRWKYEYTYRK